MTKLASIILCAGVGSRLKSAKSKILHELCGRPMGYWPIKNALEAQANETIVVVGHQALEHEKFSALILIKILSSLIKNNPTVLQELFVQRLSF